MTTDDKAGNFEDVIQRRMQNTGESYAEARKHVEEAREAMILMAAVWSDDQSWVEEWTSDRAWQPDEEALQWMRSRPKVVQDLMTRFPPSCAVRAKKPLYIPALSKVGIVTSYNEGGLLGVRQHPDSKVFAHCDPEDLEVVGYWRGWTPERVKEVLRGANDA